MPRSSERSRTRKRTPSMSELRSRWLEIALDQPEWQRPAAKNMSTVFGVGTALGAYGLANISGVYEANGKSLLIAIAGYTLGRSEVRRRITFRWRRRSPGGSSVLEWGLIDEDEANGSAT